MIKSFIIKYRKSDLAKGFVALFTGSLLAQLIPVGISPLLTRIYEPSEFGTLALFLSISTILASVSTGKYELAIFLPEKDEDAFVLVLLSSVLLVFFSIVSFIVFLAFGSSISFFLGNEGIQNWLLFIPFSFFLTGISNTLMYWHNRGRKYRLISKGKILQSGMQASSNLIMGYSGLGIVGLISSNILGTIIRTIIYFSSFLSFMNENIKNIKFVDLKKQANKYKKFPKYFVFGNFLNVLSSQLPILLFSNFYGAEIVGFFAISQRIIMTPSSLISKSVGDVFRQNISESYKAGTCRELLISNVKRLFFIGVIPFSLIAIFAPIIFQFVFGEDWIESGRYIQILSLMFFFQFVFSALSSIVIQVSQRLEIDILWQICLVVLNSSAIYLGYYLLDNVYYSLFFYSIIYAIMYVVSFVIALQNSDV